MIVDANRLLKAIASLPDPDELDLGHVEAKMLMGWIDPLSSGLIGTGFIRNPDLEARTIYFIVKGFNMGTNSGSPYRYRFWAFEY